jgi:hypothetical protein
MESNGDMADGLPRGLFNDVLFQCRDYIASNCRMIDELWIGKDLEGNGRCAIEVLSRDLLEVTEESRGKKLRLAGVPAGDRTGYLSLIFTATPIRSVSWYTSTRLCAITSHKAAYYILSYWCDISFRICVTSSGRQEYLVHLFTTLWQSERYCAVLCVLLVLATLNRMHSGYVEFIIIEIRISGFV